MLVARHGGITIVTGVIAIVANKDKPSYIWIAIFPALLLAFLDSYYLGLEQCFRNQYNDFVKKLHDNIATSNDLFIIVGHPNTKDLVACSLKAVQSVSVLTFYGLMGIMLIIVHALIG